MSIYDFLDGTNSLHTDGVQLLDIRLSTCCINSEFWAAPDLLIGRHT